MTKLSFPNSIKNNISNPIPSREFVPRLRCIDYFVTILFTVMIFTAIFSFICMDVWKWKTSVKNVNNCGCRKENFTRYRPKSIQEYKIQFKNFIKQNNRNYSTKAEEDLRFAFFLRNVMQIEETNGDNSYNSDHKFTSFTDWSEEEFQSILIPTENERNEVDEKEIQLIDENDRNSFRRIEYVDWRTNGKVTPVKNQYVKEPCASCYAFASIAAIESQYAIKMNLNLSLSEQEIVGCDPHSQGCEYGFSGTAMTYIKKNGLYPAKLYPYEGIDYNHTICRDFFENKTYISDVKRLPPDERLIAMWVANHGPLTFGMRTTYEFAFVQDKIYSPSRKECDDFNVGRHAMAIVGFGTEGGKDFYWVKNSWGRNWGINGYFKLARGVNTCRMAEKVLVPFISIKN